MRSDYIFLAGITIIVITKLFFKFACSDNVSSLFDRIKKLFGENDIYFPFINDMICEEEYNNIINCNNLTINKKIDELNIKINEGIYFNKSFDLLYRDFLIKFKIMKLIYDNFFHYDRFKPHAKIYFSNSKWYEVAENIKYLAIIDNNELNLDNLDSSIEELTIYHPTKPLINLPPGLKKLHLYNIDFSDVQKIKVPVNCELYVESCLINRIKL